MFTLITVAISSLAVKAAAAGLVVGVATGAYKAHQDRKNGK